MNPADKKIRIANKKTECIGRVYVSATIGSLTYNVCFYVVMGLQFDSILGLDLMNKFSLYVNIDFRIIQQLITNEGKPYEDEIMSNYSRVSYQNQINVFASDNAIDPDLNDLLNNYVSAFSKDKYDIGRINIEQCRVKLSDDFLICLRPYRVSAIDQKRIDDQVDFLLSNGLIRRSFSPYSFPITLVNKKDEGEKTRLCVDYRKLNKITIPDDYPFPRIDDILDRLSDAKIFSVFDISSGFWHVAMNPDDVHKTAFVTMNDHFEWLVMPFGFRNSPAVFQRIIYTILRKHNLDFAHNYLDDILIHSKSIEEHHSHLEKFFQVVIEEGIKLKLSKSQIAKTEVIYLGHKLTIGQVAPLSDNTKAVLEFPTPSSVKSLQQFLGKVNYYRRFIPNASKLMRPLHDLLCKNAKFKWTSEQDTAFKTVKELFCKEPILMLYKPNEPLFLYADASREGIGAVLKQLNAKSNKLHPVGYFSRKLLNYQKNYSVTELECLAIVSALDFWHHYLYGRRFTIVTDHFALKYLRDIKKPGSRLFNWSLKLDQYDYDVTYTPGSLNTEADCLSRNPIDSINPNYETHKKFINLLDKDALKLEQEKEFPLTDLPKRYFRKDGLVVRKKGLFTKIYVPKSLRGKLIFDAHEDLGHIGYTKMCQLICKNYIWENMTKDIKLLTENCEVCLHNKPRREKPIGFLSHLLFATEPFNFISIDTVGGLNKYNSKMNYLHLAVDERAPLLADLTS